MIKNQIDLFVHTLKCSFNFVSKAEAAQASQMKTETELKQREQIIFDLRNKIATIEAQLEYGFVCFLMY